MRGKVVAFVNILVVLVLIISPQMIVARGLVQITSTGTVRVNPLKPKPPCNGNVYGSCIARPTPKRRCDHKNRCGGRPPPLPTTKTQP